MAMWPQDALTSTSAGDTDDQEGSEEGGDPEHTPHADHELGNAYKVKLLPLLVA
jgi:hypothetical protein